MFKAVSRKKEPSSCGCQGTGTLTSGRQGRAPHHGHHPRSHPLNKVQVFAEWEKVEDQS
jgi:hypothetical protein